MAQLLKLVDPHFITTEILAILNEADESLSDEQLGVLYERFVRAREQAIIGEIRRVCGIEVLESPVLVGDDPDDEIAPDVLETETSLEDELADLLPTPDGLS